MNKPLNITRRALAGLVCCASMSLCMATESAKGSNDLLRMIQRYRMVDLTHSFGSETPVWKGFGQATIAAAADPITHEPYSIDKDGFRASVYTLVGQYGTHIDPPAHFSKHGKTMDQIPLEQMILPIVVFDITPKLSAEPAYALTVADILEWEKKNGQIPAGSFAALRTDMYKDWTANPERFKRSPFPAWSKDAVKFLVEKRKVVAIGHESMDTDDTPNLVSESWILKHNHYQIEVMANLDQLPETGAVVIVSWPKVQNGLGFPARVIGLVPKN